MIEYIEKKPLLHKIKTFLNNWASNLRKDWREIYGRQTIEDYTRDSTW